MDTTQNYVLAIDTATTTMVAGIVGPKSASRLIEDTRHHNELLVPTIEILLEELGITYADLAAIVVGYGPGPFTGLRVGIATAESLGLALGIPVYGVCTLDALARTLDANGELLVATDARRREAYWATYRRKADGELIRTTDPQVTAPDKIAHPEGLEFDAASIAASLPELNIPVREIFPNGVRVQDLVDSADFSVEPTPIKPAYLRRPDAVPPKPIPRSSALPPLEV